MQSEGDEGGICVVAESCHQTSEGIGLMASDEEDSFEIFIMNRINKSNRNFW